MTTLAASPAVGRAHKLLLHLDAQPMGAVWRVALGAAIALAWIALSPARSVAGLLGVFAAALVLLRVVPVAIRVLIPFPAAVKSSWARRRLAAKRYDSYQLRKLLWLGIGLALGLAVAGSPGIVPAALSAACVIVGLGGMIVWRGRFAALSPSQREGIGG